MADTQVMQELAPQSDPHVITSGEQYSPNAPAMPQAPVQQQAASDPYAGAIILRHNSSGIKPSKPSDPYEGATIIKYAEKDEPPTDPTGSTASEMVPDWASNMAKPIADKIDPNSAKAKWIETVAKNPPSLIKALQEAKVPGDILNGKGDMSDEEMSNHAMNLAAMIALGKIGADHGDTEIMPNINDQMKSAFGDAAKDAETNKPYSDSFVGPDGQPVRPNDTLHNTANKPPPAPSDARMSADKLQQEYLKSEGLTAKEWGDRLAAKNQSSKLPIVGLDALQDDVNGNLTQGRSMLQLAAAAANKPGEASVRAGNLLAREPFLRGHLNDTLNDELSNGSFYSSRDEALSKLATDGKAAQQEAFSQAPVYNDRIKQFLQDRDVQAGIRHGYNIQKDWALANNEPFKPTDMGVVDFNEAGDPIFGETPNMKALDAGRKGMQDMVDRNIDGRFMNETTGKPTEAAAAFMAKKKAYTEALKQANPAYEKYLNTAGDEMERLDALNKGRDFTKRDPEEIDAFLNGNEAQRAKGLEVTPSEPASEGAKAFYKVGVRRNIQDMLRGNNGDASVLNNLWKDKIQDRLNPIIGDEGMDRLNTHINDQKSILRSNRAFGGSNTFDKFTADQAIRDASAMPVEAHAATAARFVAHPVRAAADFASRMLQDSVKDKVTKMSNDTAAELMKDYTTNDPEHLYALSKRLGEPQGKEK